MKKILAIGTIVVLALMLVLTSFNSPAIVNAETSDESNVVSVNGAGSVSVKPDIAYINVGVETQNADAAVAQAENAEIMTKVMAALKEVGIAEDDIQTLSYNIYNRTDYNDSGEDTKYYQVNNTLKVTIRDVNAVGKVIDAATVAGSNEITSIQFGISNEEEVYQEALTAAMGNAKNKATTIMATFGKKPGVPSKVVESGYNAGIARIEMNALYADAKSSTSISTGSISVTANVSVEYEY